MFDDIWTFLNSVARPLGWLVLAAPVGIAFAGALIWYFFQRTSDSPRHQIAIVFAQSLYTAIVKGNWVASENLGNRLKEGLETRFQSRRARVLLIKSLSDTANALLNDLPPGLRSKLAKIGVTSLLPSELLAYYHFGTAALHKHIMNELRQHNFSPSELEHSFIFFQGLLTALFADPDLCLVARKYLNCEPYSLTTKIYAKLEAMSPREPQLTLRETAAGVGDRLFFFGAKDRIPWVGRETEMNELRTWLIEPSSTNFSWALITGPAGMGKSRLAFELASELQGLWNAGFLVRQSVTQRADAFKAFDPSRPQFIIIDYPAEDPDEVRAIVATIKSLISGGSRFPFPVRVMLLERAGKELNWYNKIIAGLQPDIGNGVLFDLQDLGEDNLYAIVKNVAGAVACPPFHEAIPQLREIDPQGSPLFAAFAGEALSKGRKMRELDRIGLLNDVLVREEKRWSLVTGGRNEKLELYKNAIALATALGARHDGNVIPYDDLLPFASFDQEIIREMIGSVSSDDIEIAPIEPDILGEYFVLLHLKVKHFGKSASRGASGRLRKRFLDALGAYMNKSNEDARSFAYFIARVTQDFPEEAVDSGILEMPSTLSAPAAIALWLNGANAATLNLCDAGLIEQSYTIYCNVLRISENSELDQEDKEIVFVVGVSLVQALCVNRDYATAHELWNKLNAQDMAQSLSSAALDRVGEILFEVVALCGDAGQEELGLSLFWGFVNLRDISEATPVASEYLAMAAQCASQWLRTPTDTYPPDFVAVRESLANLLYKSLRAPRRSDARLSRDQLIDCYLGLGGTAELSDLADNGNDPVAETVIDLCLHKLNVLELVRSGSASALLTAVNDTVEFLADTNISLKESSATKLYLCLVATILARPSDAAFRLMLSGGFRLLERYPATTTAIAVFVSCIDTFDTYSDDLVLKAQLAPLAIESISMAVRTGGNEQAVRMFSKLEAAFTVNDAPVPLKYLKEAKLAILPGIYAAPQGSKH